MSKLLTISIPTYNRFEYLKLCLEQLIPQVEEFQNEVEIYITDNHSTDGTEAYVRSLKEVYPFVIYNRNETNIGYAGNQVNCFVAPTTAYTAILCDDDVYQPGALSTLLSYIRGKQYALIAINYVGFTKAFDRPEKKVYAPSKDKVFSRGYDIMNHPSVGHYSGLIFQTQSAKEVVKQLVEKFDKGYHERMRGVIFDVANRLTAKSELPALFIGKRILACYKQDVLDYDGLKHLCIDYYNYFQTLHEEGVITSEDLTYRKQIVQQRLLRSAFSTLCSRTKEQIRQLWFELENSNLLGKRNRVQSKLIFRMALFPVSKLMMKGVYKTYRLLKTHH